MKKQKKTERDKDKIRMELEMREGDRRKENDRPYVSVTNLTRKQLK